jgi:hypothetical protein
LIPVLREQKIRGLAMLIHGTVEIVPLTFDSEIGLVLTPADPHRPLAAMKRLL